MTKRLEALKREREQLLDDWASDKDDVDSRSRLLVKLMDLEDEIGDETA